MKKLLTYLFAAGLLAVWMLSYLTMTADAEPTRPEHTKATMPLYRNWKFPRVKFPASSKNAILKNDP